MGYVVFGWTCSTLISKLSRGGLVRLKLEQYFHEQLVSYLTF